MRSIRAILASSRIMPAAEQAWQTEVDVDWLASRQETAAAAAKIQSLQGNTQPVVHEERLADWSA